MQKSKQKFSVNYEANLFGTSLQGYFNCSYSKLKKHFGEANESDEYKISSVWIFENDETGEVFRLYDYKETNLFDPSLPSVKSFRRKRSHDWHVGGKGSIDDFIEWLNEKINSLKRKLVKKKNLIYFNK